MPHPDLAMMGSFVAATEIYAAPLRAHLEKEHTGQVVIIDVESGDYETGHDSLAANNRALAKHPGAVLYGIRVGYDVVEVFAGSS